MQNKLRNMQEKHAKTCDLFMLTCCKMGNTYVDMQIKQEGTVLPRPLHHFDSSCENFIIEIP